MCPQSLETRLGRLRFEPWLQPFVDIIPGYFANNEDPDEIRNASECGISSASALFAEIQNEQWHEISTMWHFDMCRLGRASAASF